MNGTISMIARQDAEKTLEQFCRCLSLWLLAAIVLTGCDRKLPSQSDPSSRPATAAIFLGEPAKERGQGLGHIHWEKDGLTVTTNVDGKPCRYLELAMGDPGYLYFFIEPDFKKTGLSDALIEIEYFDDKRGSLGLEFDASKTLKIENPAYADAGPTVAMHGSQRWQLAGFHASHTTFQRAQNGGADFRFRVTPPSLYVRRVAVTPLNRPLGLVHAAPLPKDFTYAGSVTLVVGDAEKEYGTGLQHLYFEPEGPTLTAVVEGLPCRALLLTNRNVGYLYFIVDPTFKKGDIEYLEIEVSYYDHAPGAFGLEYDASGGHALSNPAYTRCPQVARMTGAKEWRTATFATVNATFRNAQNSRGDFRLWVTPPEFYFSRVTIRRGKLAGKGVSPPPARHDFSKASSVTIALGEPARETGGGLFHLDYEKDGLTTPTQRNATPCRALSVFRVETGYFYFRVDPSFKPRALKEAVVEVEFFDGQTGTLELEYDASATLAVPNPAYAKAGPPVRMSGAGDWRTATFRLPNPTFNQTQNAGADFRICARPPELWVRRVSLKR